MYAMCACIFPKVFVVWTSKLTLRMYQLSFYSFSMKYFNTKTKKVCSGACYACAKLAYLHLFSPPESVIVLKEKLQPEHSHAIQGAGQMPPETYLLGPESPLQQAAPLS